MAEPTPPVRLGLAEQALINLAGALTCRVMVTPADDAMLIDCMAEVLPHVQRRVPPLRGLAEAAQRPVEVARARKPGTDWPSAHLALSQEAARVLIWRGGLALDAWRATVVEATPAVSVPAPGNDPGPAPGNDPGPQPTAAPDGPSHP